MSGTCAADAIRHPWVMNAVRTPLETTVVAKLVAAVAQAHASDDAQVVWSGALMAHFASVYGQGRVAALQSAVEALSVEERTVATSGMLDRILQGRASLFLQGM